MKRFFFVLFLSLACLSTNLVFANPIPNFNCVSGCSVIPSPLPTFPWPISVDGTPATGVSQDAGATGAIGWLSSIVQNLRTLVTTIQTVLKVQIVPGARVTLTSSSTTSCTAITTGVGSLDEIVNSGAAQTVYLTIYLDEGATPTCSAADLVYGDGTSIVLGRVQVTPFGLPSVSGIAYKLSGSLGANVSLIYH